MKYQKITKVLKSFQQCNSDKVTTENDKKNTYRKLYICTPSRITNTYL